MSELLPCPFCGGEAHTYKNNLWHVACEQALCGCVTMSAFITEAEAIDAWNTRAERTCRNVDEEYPYFECSECGCHAVVGYRGSGAGLPNYCPNCGAKVVSE